MSKSNCPYLGLINDSDSYMDFPNINNACLHARPEVPPKLSHQKKYCLSKNYLACPIFLRQAISEPLPKVMVAEDFLKAHRYRMIKRGIYGIIILLFALTVITYVTGSPIWNFLYRWQAKNNSTLIIPNTNLRMFSTVDAHSTLSTTINPQTAQKNDIVCQPKEGWIEYVIKPTDSLFRISLLFGISIEELQEANCMGDSTYVNPLQVIYIPLAPTATPTQTNTPTATRTYQYIPPSATATNVIDRPSAPQPTKTPLPTQAPATQPPPTATNAPPTSPPPTPTIPPPPTQPPTP